MTDRRAFYYHSARRYLRDRHARWADTYSQLPNQGRQADDFHYTEEAKSIFPRYQVLDAMAVEVDVLDPDRLPPDNALLEWLQTTALGAENLFTKRRESSSVEGKVQEEERQLFLQFVEALPQADVEPIAALPYRRTLGTEEARQWRSAIQRSWGLDGLDFWEPLRRTEVGGKPVLALQSDAFWNGSEPTGTASLAIRRALLHLDVSRLLELREHGPEFELETETAAFVYTGAEGMFFSRDLDWLIFASHEGVTTLGGSVVDELRRSWSGLDLALWEGRD